MRANRGGTLCIYRERNNDERERERESMIGRTREKLLHGLGELRDSPPTSFNTTYL